MENLLRLRLILAINIALILSGCNAAFYAPTGPNVPLFKAKHEAQLTAGFSTTGGPAGAGIQGAYALGKHIGIIANTQYLSGNGDGWKGRNLDLETGIGYTAWLNSDLAFEIYGGMGRSFGRQQKHLQPNESINAKNYKGFIQPSIGHKSNNSEFIFTSKLAFVNYDEPFTYVTEEKVYDLDWMLYGTNTTFQTVHKEGPEYIVFEPAITYRIGNEDLKFQFQLAFSFNDVYKGQPVFMNAGLNFRFPPRLNPSLP